MAENPGSSLEFNTLKENISYLEQTLSGNLRLILNKLNEKGLIKHDAYDRVKETPSLLTPEQKAGLIVTNLRDVVKLSAYRYHELIEVLSDKEVANHFKDAVKELKKPFLEKYADDVDGEDLKPTIKRQKLNEAEVSREEEIEGLLMNVKEGDRSSLIKLLTNHRYDPKTQQNEERETLLHLACRYGHFDIVRTLIEVYQCDLEVVDRLGNSPFHTACAYQHFKIAAYFCLMFPVSLLSSNYSGDTMLHIACKKSSLPIIKLIFRYMLYNCGGNPPKPLKQTIYQDNAISTCFNSKSEIQLSDFMKNCWNKVKYTPLHYACYYGHLKTMKFFLKEASPFLGCELIDNVILSSLLEIVCKQGHHYIFDYLISMSFPGAHVLRAALQPSVTYFSIEQYLKELETAPSFGLLLSRAIQRADKTLFDHMIGSKYYIHCETNDTLLHAACISCDFNMVTSVYSLLNSQSLSICKNKNKKGNTCLHLACEWGSLEITKFLVDKGFEVTEQNLAGETPLHLCITYERWLIFEYLLKKHGSSIDINATTNDGETLLHLATYNANLLLYAKKILGHPSFDSINACDGYGESPIFNACRTGEVSIMSELEERGCDVLAKNKLNETVLHIACRMNMTNVLGFLFNKIDYYPHKWQNCFGQTLLHVATRESFEMVTYLAESNYRIGEDINLVDDVDGLTPLQYACKEKHQDLFELLLENPDCDPDMKSNSGDTVLHISCRRNLESMAKLCLKHCSVAILNNSGNTALHIACESGLYELALSLLQDFHTKIPSNRDGSTLLHLAAGHEGTASFIKYVVEEKICDYKAKDESGDTALHIACSYREMVMANIEYLASLHYDEDHWYNNSNESPLCGTFSRCINNVDGTIFQSVISLFPMHNLKRYFKKIFLYICNKISYFHEEIDVPLYVTTY